MNAEQLSKKVERTISYLNDQMNEWKESFEKDPAHALEWGTKTVEQAAELKVLKGVQNALSNGVAFEVVAKQVARNVVSGARYVPSSTSPMSNLVKQYELVAWAKIAEWMED